MKYPQFFLFIHNFKTYGKIKYIFGENRIILEISHKRDVKISLKSSFTQSERNAQIRVVCGPMFSGKTKTLIRVINEYKTVGKKVFVFKPKIDDRYAEDSIVSHDKDETSAFNVIRPIEILDYHLNADVIAIDEVQFFDDSIIEVCNTLTENGKTVICAGLDLDYRGLPFGPMPKILAIADEIIKLNSVCTFCSGPARISHRITQEKEQVVLGEKEKYVPLCRSCYTELK
jgi:thymidine kinase